MCWKLRANEVGVTADRREVIVEVVGDSGCHAAESLGLLRLEQLLFERLPLRHVDEVALNELRLSLRVEHQN